MLNEIIILLKHSDASTDNIKIAKGKYKLPQTLKEAIIQFKDEYKWSKK